MAVKGRRHLIFATDSMLSVMATAKAWYMDGTFSVVKEPFKQLYTIHVYIRSENNIKQIPVAFILMSGKRKRDYVAVFRHLRNILPTSLNVREVVMDFEEAVWRAMAEIFPTATRKGCAFHWAQSVWRKMQELGLQRVYNTDDSINKFCRKLFALPLLPHEVIEPTFSALQNEATSNHSIILLCNYIGVTWLVNDIWSPEA